MAVEYLRECALVETRDYNLDNRRKEKKKGRHGIITLAVVFKYGFGMEHFAHRQTEMSLNDN